MLGGIISSTTTLNGITMFSILNISIPPPLFSQYYDTPPCVHRSYNLKVIIHGQYYLPILCYDIKK